MGERDFTVSVSDSDIDAITKAIKDGPRPKAAVDTKVFCDKWPDVKNALNLLSTLIGVVPGVNIGVKAAIGVIIAVGDAVSKAVCPPK